MESSEVADLIAALRHVVLHAPGTALQEIDDALHTTTDLVDRGKLYLARSLAQQGASETAQAATDACLSVTCLLEAGDRRSATFATACAAGLTQRAGDTARALDLAVDALVLLREEQFLDENLVRAANAMAVLFAQISSFDLAIESSRQAVSRSPDSIDPNTRVAIAYTHGYCAVEALRLGNMPEEMRSDLDTDLAVAVKNLNSPAIRPSERAILGSGMAAEQLLLSALDHSHESTAALSEMLEQLDEGCRVYDETWPRLRSWHQLVTASVLLRLGELGRAKALLDEAIPVLRSISDHHRLLRALNERSEVHALSGDMAAALADSRHVVELCRTWQQHQGARLGSQIAQRAELELGRLKMHRRAEELARQAAEDPVTGLGTRRWLEKELDALSLRDGSGAVIMLDLDNFKGINDVHGHAIGDAVLREVGGVLGSVAGVSTTVARFGGEEFVVLVPGANSVGGADLAEWARQVVSTFDWERIAEGLQVTISAGVAAGPLSDIRHVMGLADAALYDAKRAGRDRVFSAGQKAAAA